jgi:hypothetical protein
MDGALLFGLYIECNLSCSRLGCGVSSSAGWAAVSVAAVQFSWKCQVGNGQIMSWEQIVMQIFATHQCIGNIVERNAMFVALWPWRLTVHVMCHVSI